MACLVLFGLTTAAHAQATWHVDDNAPGGDGTSWSQAFSDLQDALDEAAPDDLIKVAQGTYTPGTARTDSFAIPDETTLEGGYAGYGASDPDERDVEEYETILSGDIGTVGINTDNSYNVVTVAASVDDGITLDGFTIKDGNGNTTTGSSDTRRGAGVRIKGRAAVIACTIKENRVAGRDNLGAGIAIIGGDAYAVIRGCTVSDNVAADDSTRGGTGGGIAFINSSHTMVTDNAIVACTIAGNEGQSSGGPPVGGGIYVCDSTAMIVCSEIVENLAETGAGIGITSGTSYSSYVVMASCLIADNGDAATDDGGGVYAFASTVSVINCTIAQNAVEGYWGDHQSGGGGSIANSIVWNNAGEDEIEVLGDFEVSYSDVEGGWDGTGNINSDPEFIDPDNGNFRLGTDPQSPCVDEGAAASNPDDELDADDDDNEDEETPDLDLNGRLVAAEVDMGAYEQQPNTVNCGADTNGDGMVDVLDLVNVILDWDTDGTEHNGDVNGSGLVNVGDLTAVITTWGPCPGTSGEPASLQTEITAAGLTWPDDWNAFTAHIDDENYRCWMYHYLTSPCGPFCPEGPDCPGSDPF